ncbi:hypothetical protein BV133_1726 [Blastochloris viridis]|uniref:Uncharacterized protein n=1 Tax=Blastochloris viridis TaxID=1079 RepID=A0A182D1K5_BLAVI|nr:hypothetical protein BV133_1726 [Blastochloris viridis]
MVGAGLSSARRRLRMVHARRIRNPTDQAGNLNPVNETF